MSENKVFNFGQVNDEDSSLQTKQGGKFGLNTNCKFSLIDFTDKAGKDNTEGNAVDINILVGDREFRRRVYDPTGKALYGKDNEQIAPGGEGYYDLLEKELTQTTAMVLHAVKATGVTQDAINRAVTATNPSTWEAYVQVLISLLPSNYKQVDIDVFLNYQWNISEGQKTTFLELPKNMKQGSWLAISVPKAEWKEIKDDNGLMYVDKSGNKHKISKSASFMEGNFAKQQKIEERTHPGMQDTDTGGKSVW